MAIRKATAQWTGEVKSGNGSISLGSGAFKGAYSFGTRFGEEPGTNPEELIGAALAACYSMALSAELGKNGHVPTKIDTTAAVAIEQQRGGFTVTHIDLTVSAAVPNLNQTRFAPLADKVLHECPVARALAGTTLNLNATLT
jgi:osmotically inducible protein OsmC